ncbi:SUN domain-containing protein 5-like isoform X4 [Columba livia]|uniref:SUN domain-containing protein 5-like isoform X4 n=1 Tax=Columba livia TaxID=8932 RepID=UPI0031BAF90F
MARRKAPQRRCREASKGSLEAKADQEPAGEAAGPSRCQTSGSAGTRLELVTRFWKSSPGSATQGFAKWRNEATKIAWIVFSLTCRGAGALVSLWTCLPSVSVFAMHKMAPKKNWFVMDRQRMQFLRDRRCFRVILLLLLVALGIYSTTLMPGWTTRAKGWMEEQICGSAIERKIQSDYQALLVAQNQNMRRLLQEVAQLRVQLISARKAASEAASQVSVEMSDWALQSAGAAIDTRRTSQTYGCQGNWICGVIQLFHAANPPEAVLQPDVSPGNCWPFQGRHGQVVIRLPARVHLRAVTVQHISKEASPSGSVISAPRDVAVFGLDADGEEETLLGMFMYNVAKEPIQTFPLKVRSTRGGKMPGSKAGLPARPQQEERERFLAGHRGPQHFWELVPAQEPGWQGQIH